MAAIRSKDTSIERAVFSELRRRGIYFVKHYDRAPGRPDIALPSKRIAIFIDGDFWHGYRYPVWRNKLKNKFWTDKIEKNRGRDKRNFAKLRRRGWTVLRIWEHEIEANFEDVIKRASRLLKS
jgi:DNA mismatch endonuclease (patch repair protein)